MEAPMPIYEEIRDSAANVNFKGGVEFPSSLLQARQLDNDRQRNMMADNAIERQNAQNQTFQTMKDSLMKRVIEPDVESAGAYKEIRSGISETSQGYHFANQGQQVTASIANNINNLSQVVQNLQTQLHQLSTTVLTKQS